tara:strand:- start:908 stop:1138 length:231 start_codon:yes stop_codon:yes gene_type:complete
MNTEETLSEAIVAILEELELIEPESDYLTQDQLADLIGNHAYIQVEDYDDLEYVTESMREVFYVVGHTGRSNMYLR